MENASKALIIAGAILISILLIAISMYVYNAAQGTISEAGSQMSKQEKDMYNSAVSSYVGDNKKGIDARACIDSIISSNNTYIGDSGKFIGLSIGESQIGKTAGGEEDNNETVVSEAAAAMSTAKTQINTGKRYTITAQYSGTGLIKSISITEKTSGKGTGTGTGTDTGA